MDVRKWKNGTRREERAKVATKVRALLHAGVFARMLECPELDRYGRWDYDRARLRVRMTNSELEEKVVRCIRSNIPGGRRYVPTSYISDAVGVHTFVDGDDRMGDEEWDHVGGNLGFLVRVENTSVACSYIADASTTSSSGRPCRAEGEEYRRAYLEALRGMCRHRASGVRAVRPFWTCCHRSLETMIGHHVAVRRRARREDWGSRCVRGHAAAMNQVQIAFDVGQIQALFVRENYDGFSRHWRVAFPKAFRIATGVERPLHRL